MQLNQWFHEYGPFLSMGVLLLFLIGMLLTKAGVRFKELGDGYR